MLKEALPDHDRDSSLTSSDQSLKGFIIRGLVEAHMRNPETDLATYIQAYVYVQASFPLDGISVVLMRASCKDECCIG